MNTKFRVICLILAAFVILLLAASCQPTTSTTPVESTGSTTGTTTGGTTTTTKATEEDPIQVVFYINNGSTTGSASKEEELELVHQWFLDQINIDIQYIVPPADQAEEKLDLILTSNQKLDAFWGEWPKYSSLGMIQPITEIYSNNDFPGIREQFEPYFGPMIDAEGTLWGLPRVFNTAPYPFIWRSDYAEKVGITKAPETIDELSELLYAFRDKDPAGDGKTIPVICTGLSQLEYCLLAGYTDGGRGLWLDSSDNKVKHHIVQPGYVDFLSQIKQWYDDGILYKESFNINTQQLRELAEQGRVASTLQWYSAFGVSLQNMYTADKTTPAVGAITHDIKGPNGKYAETAAPGSKSGLVFSAKADEATVIAGLKVVDFQLADLNAWYNATYGIDNWKFVEGSEVAAEPLEEAENVGTKSYQGEYRVAIGKLRIDEFKELLSRDDRYISSNGQTAGIFFYYSYTYHLYEPVEKVTKALDFDIPFNMTEVSNEVSAYSDITTMIDEETIKFVTGVRPMSDWENFIETLYSIGMDEVEENLTAQYQAAQ